MQSSVENFEQLGVRFDPKDRKVLALVPAALPELTPERRAKKARRATFIYLLSFIGSVLLALQDPFFALAFPWLLICHKTLSFAKGIVGRMAAAIDEENKSQNHAIACKRFRMKRDQAAANRNEQRTYVLLVFFRRAALAAVERFRTSISGIAHTALTARLLPVPRYASA